MISICEYLKVKNIKGKGNVFPYDYCLVVPYNDSYGPFEDDWADVMIPNNANSRDPNFFLLTKRDASSYRNDENIIFYEIPEFCKTMDDVESAGNDGRLDLDELEPIKL